MTEQLLIVGGGQAAVQAVHSLRQGGYAGRVTLVCGETRAPYQRPPLSKKYLSGELPAARLELRPAAWYAQKQVDVVLGARAVELDAAARRVRVEDGRTFDYDRLIIATGSRPRRLDVPGVLLRGVHELRTLDDVDRIAPQFEAGRRLVLVGAGYIGLEVAAVAVKRGLHVTVVEATERAMSRVVGPAVSQFFHQVHEQAGVNIRFGEVVDAFAGTEQVEAVITADGQRYPCDLAIVGVGVVPNLELAQSAQLPCDNGIAVDEFARTADERIFAAGDCTSFPHPLAEARIRLESVQNAIEQAKAAASAINGAPQAYTEPPWFWSDQYDLKLQIAGLVNETDEAVMRGDAAARSFAVYYLRGGRLAAVEAVNSPRDFMFARKAIAAGVTPDVGRLADPATDVTALLPG